MIYFHFTPGSPQSPNTDGGFGKRQSSFLAAKEGRKRQRWGAGPAAERSAESPSAWLITELHHSLLRTAEGPLPTGCLGSGQCCVWVGTGTPTSPYTGGHGDTNLVPGASPPGCSWRLNHSSKELVLLHASLPVPENEF